MAKYTKKSKQKLVSDAKERSTFLKWSIIIPLILITIIALINYRYTIYYSISDLFFDVNDYAVTEQKDKSGRYEKHNLGILERHSGKTFGIDISQYQGKIKWEEVNLIHEKTPIDFIYVRATMGCYAKDMMFSTNWEGAKKINKLRGAYHYFRPNENSSKQAENFIKTVKLEPGDLPPVLDIEEHPKKQSMDSLRVGLKRWLTIVEMHYKVKPILYSGDKFYTDFLLKEFDDYVLWIANYNFWVVKPKNHWNIWQFSEKGKVKGIKSFVDLNVFNSDVEDLEKLAVPFR